MRARGACAHFPSYLDSLAAVGCGALLRVRCVLVHTSGVRAVEGNNWCGGVHDVDNACCCANITMLPASSVAV
jgi:hypothetical protein